MWERCRGVSAFRGALVCLALLGIAATGFFYNTARGGGSLRSESAEARMQSEITAARELLRTEDAERFLGNPYVVSAFYYSDSFFDRLSRMTERTEPASVVFALRDLVTHDVRMRYFFALDSLFGRNARGSVSEERLARPFSSIDFGTGIAHENAVDIFAPEGTAVSAIEGGVVVLAEGGWMRGDPFSTSSVKCGNGVIVYSPRARRFSRYCHLERVTVAVGGILASGDTLGIVGHTGNADSPGRGSHVHVEMHYYDTERRVMTAMSNRKLKELIRAIP